MNNGTACGIRFGNVQIVSFVFFLPENMHRFVFSEEFHEVWMFVLLRIAVKPFGVCARAGLNLFIRKFGYTCVHVVMTCWNVTLFKYVKSTPRNLKKVGNSD